LSASSPEPERPAPQGYSRLAWLIFVVAVVFWTLILPRLRQSAPEAERGREPLQDATMRLQARTLLGTGYLLHQSGPDLYPQAQAMLDHGPYGQRLRFVTLAGELEGPAEARKQLARLKRERREEALDATGEEMRLTDLLERLYEDYEDSRLDAPSLSESDRAELRRGLGWFGKLALAPEGGPDAAARREVLDSARRAALATLGSAGGVVLLIGAGVVVLVVLGILLGQGRLRGGLRVGSPYGGVYAETFALWMVAYPALGFALGLMASAETWLLFNGLGMLASLAVLFWPVARGVPWDRLRRDLGLVLGRRPAAEPLLGLAGYAGTWPVLIVPLILVLLFTQLVKRFGWEPIEPTHPVVGPVLSGDWWVRAQVLLVACVGAPLVEETMFRGLLYRHLREASVRFGRVAGVFFSAGLTSFVFAVIHPQGLLGIPVLATLAFGFALMREWRGTLVPSMVAHAVHNGGTTLVLLLAAG
jgi:membrane protease YdiL (CAAX protease family)